MLSCRYDTTSFSYHLLFLLLVGLTTQKQQEHSTEKREEKKKDFFSCICSYVRKLNDLDKRQAGVIQASDQMYEQQVCKIHTGRTVTKRRHRQVENLVPRVPTVNLLLLLSSLYLHCSSNVLRFTVCCLVNARQITKVNARFGTSVNLINVLFGRSFAHF